MSNSTKTVTVLQILSKKQNPRNNRLQRGLLEQLLFNETRTYSYFQKYNCDLHVQVKYPKMFCYSMLFQCNNSIGLLDQLQSRTLCTFQSFKVICFMKCFVINLTDSVRTVSGCNDVAGSLQVRLNECGKTSVEG